jgi:hypothetical protein
MRHISFLASQCHFNADVRDQLASAPPGQPQSFRNAAICGAVVVLSPTASQIGDQPVWSVSASCADADVPLLISQVLPSLAAPSGCLSRSCSVAVGLMAAGLPDGTYLRAADAWTPYDQADALLAQLDAVTEVFEVPHDDPRRRRSARSIVGLSTGGGGDDDGPPSEPLPSPSSSSRTPPQQQQQQQKASQKQKKKPFKQQQQQQQQQQQPGSGGGEGEGAAGTAEATSAAAIFRGLRARCNIPANVPIVGYDGHTTTALDAVRCGGDTAGDAASGDAPGDPLPASGTTAAGDDTAAGAASLGRFLLGPEEYFRNTRVFNYGNPLGRSKGPMINDRAGTGRAANCGMGVLLRKRGRAVELQDVVLTVRPVLKGEELLAAYRHDGGGKGYAAEGAAETAAAVQG